MAHADLTASGPLIAPADGDGRRFIRHAFVCVSDSACARDGPAAAICARLKQRLREEGRKEELRVNKAGCLGQCGHGPMMVVYPEGVWYCHLTLEGAERIWEEHIVGGRPVEALRYRTRDGGTNVLPKRPGPTQGVGGEVDTASPWYSPCTRCPTVAGPAGE